MGGKHKQAQRTKNNQRPSSSGRSAELLGSTVPFIGFSTIPDGSVISLFSAVDDADPTIDSNFKLVLKKLSKKDSTTKLKALMEFEDLVKSAEPETLKAILPFWTRAYCVHSVDVEHKVRDACQRAHHAVVLKVKRNLAPYLKLIIGPWFTSQYDSYAPAASAATLAFQDAFPANKIAEVTTFCQNEILDYIYDNLIVQSPQSLNHQKQFTAEEAESKYQRLIIASLQGYSLFLNKLTTEQITNAAEQNRRITSNKLFWKYSQHENPVIRAAFFGVLTSFCQKAPVVMQPDMKALVSTIFASIDDNDPNVLPSVWEAVLHMLTNVQDWHVHVNLEKLILPKLWKVLKEGGRGNASAVYPNLLPLLCHFPSVPDQNALYKSFFENMREGWKQRCIAQSRSEWNVAITTYFECLRYVIMKYQSDAKLGDNLIAHQVLKAVELGLTETSLPSKSIFSQVSMLVQYWTRNTEEKELTNYKHYVETFWKILDVVVFENTKRAVDNQAENSQLSHLAGKVIELTMSLKESSQPKPKTHSVKFSDSPKTETEEVSPKKRPEPTSGQLNKAHETNLIDFVYKICSYYVSFVGETLSGELVDNLSLLLKEFESREFLEHLMKQFHSSGEDSASLLGLYRRPFSEWLSNEKLCTECVVDSVFILLKYLNEQDQYVVLVSMEEFSNKSCVDWCLKRAFSHPYSSMSTVRKWLKEHAATKAFIRIAAAHMKGRATVEQQLILENGLNEDINGEPLVHSEACIAIKSSLVHMLAAPSQEDLTLESCARLAVKMLYSVPDIIEGNTIDLEMLLAIFKLSCNSDLGQALLSEDTLEEVNTCWNDCLGSFDENRPVLLSLTRKCSEFVRSKLSSNLDMHSIDVIARIVVDYLKVSQSADMDENAWMWNEFVSLDESLAKTVEALPNLALFAEYLSGTVSFPRDNPLSKIRALENVTETDLCRLAVFLCYASKILHSFLAIDDETVETPVDDRVEKSIFIMHSLSCCLSILPEFRHKRYFLEISQMCDSIHLELISLFQSGPDQVSDKIVGKIFLKITAQSLSYAKTLKYAMEITRQSFDLRKKLNGMPKLPKFVTAQMLNSTGLLDGWEEMNSLDRIILTRYQVESSNTNMETEVEKFKERIADLSYQSDLDGVSLEGIIEHMRLVNSLIGWRWSSITGSLWDSVVICVSSWVSAAEKFQLTLKQPVAELKLISFAVAICQTYLKFSAFVFQLELYPSDPSDSARAMIREWKQVFCEPVTHSLAVALKRLMETYDEIADKDNIHWVYRPLFSALGKSVIYMKFECIQEKEIWTQLLTRASSLLKSPSNSLQLACFWILRRNAKAIVQADLHKINSIDDSSAEQRLLLCNIFNDTMDTLQDIVQTMLVEFKIGEDSCKVAPHTDSYVFTMSYLLLWFVILSLFEDAPADVRYQYTDWIKSKEYLKILLSNVLKLIPADTLQCIDSKGKSLFTNIPEVPSYTLLKVEEIEHLACYTYQLGLKQLPALAKQWWSDSDARTGQVVLKMTATYLSSYLSGEELNRVIKQEKSLKNATIKVYPNVREVVTVYTVDETNFELVVRLPANYPLGSIEIECPKQIGNPMQWRNWMMQLTVFLQQNNGRIWDGLLMWKDNLDKKFEGTEECYICFSVLHAGTYQMPKLICHTCKKKFHSPCLYKWFSTSNKATCPICRNVFQV